MNDLCDYMLSWFMSKYEGVEGVEPLYEMSPEVYDRAVFIIGVGVPMLLYIVVLVAFLFMFLASFDLVRGWKH